MKTQKQTTMEGKNYLCCSNYKNKKGILQNLHKMKTEISFCKHIYSIL